MCCCYSDLIGTPVKYYTLLFGINSTAFNQSELSILICLIYSCKCTGKLVNKYTVHVSLNCDNTDENQELVDK